jgi:hypothetical protein
MARRGMKFYWPLVQFLPARQYCGGRARVNWTSETRVKCEIGKLERGGASQRARVITDPFDMLRASSYRWTRVKDP